MTQLHINDIAIFLNKWLFREKQPGRKNKTQKKWKLQFLDVYSVKYNSYFVLIKFFPCVCRHDKQLPVKLKKATLHITFISHSNKKMLKTGIMKLSSASIFFNVIKIDFRLETVITFILLPVLVYIYSYVKIELYCKGVYKT